MDLTKLFEMQKVLDQKIYDRFPGLKEEPWDWKITALLAELGECANEWRGFKKWSKDQEPRTEHKVSCHVCRGEGYFMMSVDNDDEETCGYCEGTGLQEDRNPLLEEYIDCLHFILSIGNYIDCQSFERLHRISFSNDITKKFNAVFRLVANLDEISILIYSKNYELMFNEFIELGEMLGFTWDQIETAYFAKNQINHARQAEGY